MQKHLFVGDEQSEAARNLALAIKWMIENNSCIDWGEDIPYMVADILGGDAQELAHRASVK